MRIRNPRYAPEWLERKLNPSPLIPAPVSAEVQATPAAVAPDGPNLPPYDPTLPPTPVPPTAPPTGPGGPSDPC